MQYRTTSFLVTGALVAFASIAWNATVVGKEDASKPELLHTQNEAYL